VDVLHFDAAPDGTVTLDITFAVLAGQIRVARHQIFTAPSTGTGISGQAAAMSSALGQAADAIAGALSG